LDAKLSVVQDKDEWNGTDIVFEIASKGDKTELMFYSCRPGSGHRILR
jgi:hypothetical protein